MRIFLLRHGETEENAGRIVQGHLHGTLSPRGVEQAKRAACRLKSERFDAVFCSDLGRARQTAEEVMRFHAAPVMYTPVLRERSLGIYEGRPVTLYHQGMRESGQTYMEFRAPGGESIADLRRRTGPFLAMLKEQYRSKNVLLVTHGGTILTLLMDIKGAEDLTPEEFRAHDVHNASLCIAEFDADGVTVSCDINCTQHLES